MTAVGTEMPLKPLSHGDSPSCAGDLEGPKCGSNPGDVGLETLNKERKITYVKSPMSL